MDHTHETEGTGIGLALTKELIELHQGKISVSSQLGKGTTFVIQLPLGKDHLSAEEIVSDAAASDTGNRSVVHYKHRAAPATQQDGQTRITDSSVPALLVVEDNQDMRTYMRGQLENDYQVFDADNGHEGFKKAKKIQPDAIISDVMMPKMDGFELCEKLKTDSHTSHIPIILLTAKASSDSKIEGLETGADDYLTKPFDAKELRVRVKNLIEQRRRLRERFQRELKVQPSEITVTSMDEAFLQKVIAIVEENMSNDTFVTATLARQAGLSRGHLNRKLRALTNCSSREFIRILRLKRAAQLLEQGFGNVTEITYEVGFNSLSHFAKAFRKQFGVSPKEYVSQTRD